MTQDRFSAQLRQHLVESADERAADGQLTAVVHAVARTRQRTPWVARLTWTPGRVGPFPSAAIRYGLVAAALALAMVAGALMAGGGGAPPGTIFEGSWITLDPGDGSGMTLVVGPGQTPKVYFEDGYASGAACVQDAVKRFTARGTGEIFGSRLEATYPDGGGCGLETVDVRGTYLHDGRTDTLVDQDGLEWTRPLRQQPDPEAPLASPEAPAPSTTLPVSPRLGEAAFSSTLHGISLSYPEGWLIRPATEPWTGGHVRFDSPAADVIFHPELREDLYLVVASQPQGGLTEEDWRGDRLAWVCPDGGSFGSWPIDGADAFVVDCDFANSALVVTETRGYLIRLVPSRMDSELAQTYTFDWLKVLLDTVDLRPEDAIDLSTPRPDPGCTQFDAPGSYTAPAGPLSLTVALPGTASEPWLGDRDEFNVLRAACTDWDGPGLIDAGQATLVDPNACAGGTIPVANAAEAIAAIASANGIEVLDQTGVEVGGYAGTVLDIRTDDAANACPDGQIPLVDGVNAFDGGLTVRVYLIDVDGTTLALALYGYREWEPAVRSAVDAIVASMEIRP